MWLLIQDPPLKSILSRLANAVHVLSVLADVIAAPGAMPATNEETSALTDGQTAIAEFLSAIYQLFPPASGKYDS